MGKQKKKKTGKKGKKKSRKQFDRVPQLSYDPTWLDVGTLKTTKREKIEHLLHNETKRKHYIPEPTYVGDQNLLEANGIRKFVLLHCS